MDNITGNTALMPREKLIAYGASVLSDSELLAIFLRTGTWIGRSGSLLSICWRFSDHFTGC